MNNNKEAFVNLEAAAQGYVDAVKKFSETLETILTGFGQKMENDDVSGIFSTNIREAAFKGEDVTTTMLEALGKTLKETVQRDRMTIFTNR